MPPPLTLYIHIPWCVQKCLYCDFNSYTKPNLIPETRFINALLQDLEQDLALATTSQILTSIFIGGGTPSLLSGDGIWRLLTGIQALLPYNNSTEITLEANPGTADSERFLAYKTSGVNRLSLGIQSFDSKQLRTLGRIHSHAEIYQAYVHAKEAGLSNVNLDLMFGLPGQTPRSAVLDLVQAVELRPEHISWYQLTIEPNTPLYQKVGSLSLPEETIMLAIQRQGQYYLASQGFKQYEVSAYAYGTYRCFHNLNYWQFGDYIGIGPGAHGKFMDLDGNVRRIAKLSNPWDYLTRLENNLSVTKSQILSDQDIFIEFLFNALRLKEGFSLGLFEARTGLSKDYLVTKLLPVQSRGLVSLDGEQVQATSKGYQLLNQLLLILL